MRLGWRVLLSYRTSYAATRLRVSTQAGDHEQGVFEPLSILCKHLSSLWPARATLLSLQSLELG